MRHTRLALAALALAVVGTATGIVYAGEVGFIEDFAIKDREAALKQLIPGTEDYYYYHCLHYQNMGQLDKVDGGPTNRELTDTQIRDALAAGQLDKVGLLRPWIMRHGRTARVIEIENRQALLSYEKDPQGTLTFLRNRLNLTFSHQRQTLERAAGLASKLDQALISRQALSTRAWALHPNSVDGFEIAAMDWLVELAAAPHEQSRFVDLQRRSLLARLDRPDYPGLVQLIIDDLQFQYSGGFGSLQVHNKLLLSQLDELLKLKPTLLNEVNFVNAYIARLRPGEDTDVQRDLKARGLYLDRVWEFVSRLGSAHNSLKAHVLYQRLMLDRSQGTYDKERFMTYIRLPRQVFYVNPKYLEPSARRDYVVNLSADFASVTLLPPIMNDEPLVRSYLEHFFVEEDGYDQYKEFILDTYLKPVFAETKIVNGIGDSERWASLLTPEQFKALKDRVDIDFAFTNAQWHGPDDAVSLDVFVKNVKTLYVKVYQVNTLNFYRKTLSQIDTTINLDGLVPNIEQQVDYKEAPLLKVSRKFKFDQLKARGVYVIDFIGNGKASRAVIHKGQLHHLSSVGPAGVDIVVLDDSRKMVPAASVYIGEHQFTADEGGIVHVPFSTEPGNKPLVLATGDFASLDHFEHPGESYKFDVGFHVERESLLKPLTDPAKKTLYKATLAVRPRLMLIGKPLPIGLMEQPVLRIDCKDREGTATSKEVPGIELKDGREFRYDFQVPENLLTITFTLKGQIKSLVTGAKVDVSAAKSFTLNSIDLTEKVDDLFFSAAAGGFSIDALDKTGVPRASRPVHLRLKHRDFTDWLDVTLQSDAKGRVDLGALEGIRSVGASTEDGTTHTWTLPQDWHNMQSNIASRVGDTIMVPYMGAAKGPVRTAFSLLETRGGAFVKDWYDSIKLANGLVQIAGLPAGDYSLLLKETGQLYTIRITQADNVVAIGVPASQPASAPAAAPNLDLPTAVGKIKGAQPGFSVPVTVEGVYLRGKSPAGYDSLTSQDRKEQVEVRWSPQSAAKSQELKDGQQIRISGDGVFIQAGYVVVNDAKIATPTAPGVPSSDYLLGATRYLESVNPAPLQIERVEADKDNVRIFLRNATRETRVHLAAVVYLPEYSLYGDLMYPGEEPATVLPGRTDAAYVAGRDIGDEYRYILERKFAVKFPGNMLTRPSLLLNPWAIRKTDTSVLSEAQGGEYGRSAAGRPGSASFGAPPPRTGAPAVSGNVLSNYDFLGQPGILMVNMVPDKDGVVTVPRAALGAHQQFHVLALDEQNAAYRQMAIEDQPMEFRDLRLLNALDPSKDFGEMKQITVLGKGQSLIIEDRASSQVEAYDHLGKAYALYSTLNNDPTLAEFSFILQWPKFTDAQKREKYSRYACHELNFFIYKKDHDFFDKVVGPYLKNKKDKTFMDRYLVGEDLSMYMQPWAHARLNTVEQILLSQRVQDEMAKTARLIKERYDLIPPDVENFNLLFRTALKAGALETVANLNLLISDGADFTPMPTLLPTSPRAPVAALEENGRHRAAALPSPAAKPSGGAAAKELSDGSVKDQEKVAQSKHETDMHMKIQRDVGQGGKAGARGSIASLDEAKKRRSESAEQQFYRKLDKTEEWAENNYYHLLIEAQVADLVKVNGFWKDFAAQDGKAAFISRNMAEAHGNFTEIMFALSVLDLPFEASKLEPKFEGAKLTVTADGPTVVYHKEIKPIAPIAGQSPILVSQNFFRRDDRYSFVDNEKVDKYVSEEFLTHVVYGCQVVVTNPTSSRQKLEVLTQIPSGAMPVVNSLYTRSVSAQMEPFSTQAVEYYFFFPQAGDKDFTHYPTHVTKNQLLVAKAPAVMMKVVDKPSKLDTTSWDYISQQGSVEQVLAYLKDNNLLRVNLEKIAWRMGDVEFFKTIVGLLQDRHDYNDTLWSYGIKHNVPAVIREFLKHNDNFVSQTGLYIDSPLLSIDPVERKLYQHLEYAPLVNARAHRLGKGWQIANERFLQQYSRLMTVLSYRPALDTEDMMSVTYYMLLQDRAEEAMGYFAKVDAKKLPEQIQYDYCTAYMDFYKDKPMVARAIADKYKDYPVDRWRNLFASVGSQLDELDGKAGKVLDPENRDQTQGQLAAGAIGMDFTVEGRQVKLTYQNVKNVRVHYYLMDLELLFSRNPFVQQYSQDLFSYIQPNETAEIDLAADQKAKSFEIPAKFQNSNVMIEIVAGGVRRSQAYFAHSMAVQMIENYGQLKVTAEVVGVVGDGPKADIKAMRPAQVPLAKVYVKVYARMKDGTVQFYKDGYTDLRGRFDYSSLSNSQQDNVERFTMLIMSDDHGAMVKEADAPKQ